MDNFIAIDVETANYSPSSICAVGCVKIIDGEIADEFYSLVHPEPDWYLRRFTEIHGLNDDDTWNAPPFDAVWHRITAFAEGLPFVAHNAQFDHKCISEACRVYQLEPPLPFLCTLKAARKQIPRYVCPSKSLPALCTFFGIDFTNHHNAAADAYGCAMLAKILL
ncbi:MAG: exonuclease domain-containing protein [Bacteroidales bacterium]|nr:exonuclease domain-containing protein [Bacteroidales bacterium]